MHSRHLNRPFWGNWSWLLTGLGVHLLLKPMLFFVFVFDVLMSGDFGGVSSAPFIIPKHAFINASNELLATNVFDVLTRFNPLFAPSTFMGFQEFFPNSNFQTLHNIGHPLNKEGTSVSVSAYGLRRGPRALEGNASKLPRCGVLGFSLCFSCWSAWPSNLHCFLAVVAWSLKLFKREIKKERWCWTCRNWFVICDVVAKHGVRWK